MIDLTARDKQILQLLVNGNTRKQIAADLGISGKTVRNHFNNMRKKYNVATRAEMIAHAVARGDVYVYLGEVQMDVEFFHQSHSPL